MLAGKSVVVIGGGLLGSRVAWAVAEAGGRVVVADADANRAKEAADALPEKTAFWQTTDITSAESLDACLAAAKTRHGRLDALVLAAYPRNRHYGCKLEDVAYADFCENVSLHLGGYFLAAQRASLAFRSEGHGNVVFLSSIYGCVAPRFEIYNGTAMTMPVEYAAIKAGINHLAKYFAKYFKGCGIRYNCVSPGGILDGQPEAFLKAYNRHGLSKGMLDPRDILGTVLYLLSDASTFVNGQNIVVDDGWTL